MSIKDDMEALANYTPEDSVAARARLIDEGHFFKLQPAEIAAVAVEGGIALLGWNLPPAHQAQLIEVIANLVSITADATLKLVVKDLDEVLAGQPTITEFDLGFAAGLGQMRAALTGGKHGS